MLVFQPLRSPLQLAEVDAHQVASPRAPTEVAHVVFAWGYACAAAPTGTVAVGACAFAVAPLACDTGLRVTDAAQLGGSAEPMALALCVCKQSQGAVDVCHAAFVFFPAILAHSAAIRLSACISAMMVRGDTFASRAMSVIAAAVLLA